MNRGDKLKARRDRLNNRVVYWTRQRPKSQRRSIMLKYLRPRLAQAVGAYARWLKKNEPEYQRQGQQVLKSRFIHLDGLNSPTGGIARPDIVAVSENRRTKCAKTGQLVWVNPNLVAFLAELDRLGIEVWVNCITNGDHPYEDQGVGYRIHYNGNGLDLGLQSMVTRARLSEIASRHKGAVNGEDLGQGATHHHITFWR